MIIRAIYVVFRSSYQKFIFIIIFKLKRRTQFFIAKNKCAQGETLSAVPMTDNHNLQYLEIVIGKRKLAT